MRYICVNCGYIYDPKVGDPSNGVPAGTEFDDLQEGWVCPMCYVTTENFVPMD